MAEHDEWNVWMWPNLLLSTSLLPSTGGGGVMTVFNGSILIIAVYLYVMRCNLEERRTSYSRHSLEWIGVEEGVDIQWEEFHSFPIEHNKSFITSHFHDRGWDGQSNHCTTVADLNHARRHATGSTCISLQDYRQQSILIARNHSILVFQDSFSPPSTLGTSARHLNGRYDSVVQDRRIPPRNGNLLEEFLSWTEESSFLCQLTWLSAQFSAFAHDRGWFVCPSLPRLHSSTTPFGRPKDFLDFLDSSTTPPYACRISLLMWVLSHSDTHNLNGYIGWCGCHEILVALT